MEFLFSFFSLLFPIPFPFLVPVWGGVVVCVRYVLEIMMGSRFFCLLSHLAAMMIVCHLVISHSIKWMDVGNQIDYYYRFDSAAQLNLQTKTSETINFP